ncbi:DUF2799 domain-containing protein [Martelella alba]|uniref:DUF2799 domain-containing protein n=1 Tax=Martelella alba TaxID=2590451 RepID=A0ABY2SWJ6_9HYPH|nr:DUF2799 domain-containing protein [Martelella alba]TKI08902.1 DUF2799 domain-containing protein [Martelella alba]
MFRKIAVLCGLLFLLGGCGSSDPLPSGGTRAASPWYQAGYRDALAGKAVRDNDTLAEWYGNPQVDRDQYLKGYDAGQMDFCRPQTLKRWGEQHRNFPASCDGVPDAEHLKRAWQDGIDHIDPVIAP